MKGREIRWTATILALLCVSAGVARGEDWRRLMTEGKLGADLGNHDQASVAFRAVADDESAPRALRWEALVRLGLVRSAAGDPEASAEAFRSVLASYSEEPEAMRFLIQAVASYVPGKIWIDFKERFEALLRTARVVSSEGLGPPGAPKKLNLISGETELSAVWKVRTAVDSHAHRESHRSEVAAYEIDKLLGLDMVPPTVLRTLEGKEGSLQLWVYGCETYGTVRDHAPGTPEWRHQVFRLRSFDYVIQNDDRNLGNILVDASWGIILIDHSRAFADPEVAQEMPDSFDRRMLERLHRLNPSSLQARLEGVLTEAQIEGVLKRRDILVAHVEKLIEERGEQTVLF